MYPTRGWRLFGQFSGAHENLLSDISFAQIYGSAKLVHQFGPGRLLIRGEGATTLADEVLELPFSVRFFTGGDLSVRGYQFGELGATNKEGEVVGGKHLLVGSIEYDFRVRGNWIAAAFFDTGNSFGDFGNMKLKQSAGLGIRWLSPIGPIRFDAARGLNDGGFRFHITMGPDL
jgi:translocation and assembly module TamA